MPAQQRVKSLGPGLAVILLGTMLGACDSGTEPKQPPDLDGTWQWVRAISRSTGQELTPDSEGYTAHVEFRSNVSNSSRGEFEYWKNGAVETVGRFVTGFESGHGINYISWNPAPIEFHDQVQDYVVLVGDTLLLMDNTDQRHESRWAKVK